ncbi:MAG: S1 RNA-binding domain-containing protein, partial [Oscillospiraceae bacterium]
HISELSWTRIKNPSDVLSVGDSIEVYIKDLNPETHKISLGYRKAQDNPWEILKNKYAKGDIIDVTIANMTTYGAFANVIPGIDGLIHISQITDRHIEKPQDVLKSGEIVKAMVTEIDYDKKRVSLSIRALMEKDEDVSEETKENYKTTEDIVEETAE